LAFIGSVFSYQLVSAPKSDLSTPIFVMLKSSCRREREAAKRTGLVWSQ